jgi:single-strand DNA-binding protein
VNVVVLRGVLSRAPEERSLPSGRLVTYEVTVREPDQPARTAPVAWPSAPKRALSFGAGDHVVVVGRVNRRFFRAGGATQSRTEVVADAVLRSTQSTQVEAAIDEAIARLDAR